MTECGKKTVTSAFFILPYAFKKFPCPVRGYKGRAHHSALENPSLVTCNFNRVTEPGKYFRESSGPGMG